MDGAGRKRAIALGIVCAAFVVLAVILRSPPDQDGESAPRPGETVSPRGNRADLAAGATDGASAPAGADPGEGTSSGGKGLPQPGASGGPKPSRAEQLKRKRDLMIADLQGRVTDEKLAATLRIKALEGLQKMAVITPEAYSPAVIDSMRSFLGSGAPSGLKARVVHGLKGARSDAAKTALVSRLSSDEAPSVRAAAASSLGPLKTDPDVRLGLQHAMENDPDGRVRREAEKALSWKSVAERVNELTPPK